MILIYKILVVYYSLVITSRYPTTNKCNHTKNNSKYEQYNVFHNYCVKLQDFQFTPSNVIIELCRHIVIIV